MKEIIIGKNGTQPFKITANGVSREHARLTITDDGKWILEDLKSTNGTYVYDGERHCYERISKKAITPATQIRLGSDDTVLCFKCKALLFAADEDNVYYHEAFKTLQRKWNGVQIRKDKIKTLLYWTKYIALGSVIFALARFAGNWSVNTRMNLMFLGIMISSLISPILSIIVMKRKDALDDEVKETFNCPNPQCTRASVLSEKEIKLGQCSVCKKHI